MATTPEDFIKEYEAALATQDWAKVEPLIHAKACVTFSDGTVHQEKQAIKLAYERNFSLIKSEVYTMNNIHWVIKTGKTAVYLFDFGWQGIIGGKTASGLGRGTTVLINEGDNWLLMTEHLGPKAN